jgi:SAM-dependent methyltransferase
VRCTLAVAALALATLALAAGRAEAAELRARPIRYEEARSVVVALRDRLPPGLAGKDDAALAAAWPAWVSGRDRAVRERLVQGEADSLVNLLFFGTSFTSAPRLTAATLKGSDQKTAEATLERRLGDLLGALASGDRGERMALARALLAHHDIRAAAPGGRERAAVFLLENVARVRREQAAFQAKLQRTAGVAPTDQMVARATLFRDRGISLDTSIRPAFAIEEALAEALGRGLLRRGGVRRVAVVGPGLDLVEKAEGQDYYPPQSLQCLAVADSLLRLGLADAKTLRFAALDISPLVLDHLRRAAARAEAGRGYVLQLPRPREGWGAPLVDYWRRFGDAVGEPIEPIRPPATAGPVEARAVRVRPAVVAAVRPVDLNVVYSTLDLPESERFDLVVATNILVYYDTFEQCLAMTNVARMMAPGGLFLTNTLLLELPGSALRGDGYRTVVFSDRPDDGEHVLFYRRMPDTK